jgi:hypothetical protein
MSALTCVPDPCALMSSGQVGKRVSPAKRRSLSLLLSLVHPRLKENRENLVSQGVVLSQVTRQVVAQSATGMIMVCSLVPNAFWTCTNFFFFFPVSVYSSQPPTPGSISGPPSSYSSPSITTFPIPRSSQSPPIDAGPQGPIRLPNAPLTDIASLQQTAPKKSTTAPGYFPQPPVSYQGQEALRRGSMSLHCEQQRRVQFASPQMPVQSLAPMSGLTSESPIHQSPQITQMQISSPLMMTSSPVPAAAEPPSS